MRDTAFDRSDRLPAGTALGYLEGMGRTNLLHLPVRGVGDGGAVTTVARPPIVLAGAVRRTDPPDAAVERLIAPRSDVPAEGGRYGLGFWLAAHGPAVALEGMDAGVSARTAYDPSTEAGYVGALEHVVRGLAARRPARRAAFDRRVRLGLLGRERRDVGAVEVGQRAAPVGGLDVRGDGHREGTLLLGPEQVAERLRVVVEDRVRRFARSPHSHS